MRQFTNLNTTIVHVSQILSLSHVITAAAAPGQQRKARPASLACDLPEQEKSHTRARENNKSLLRAGSNQPVNASLLFISIPGEIERAGSQALCVWRRRFSVLRNSAILRNIVQLRN